MRIYIEVDQDPTNDGSYLRLDEFGNARGGIRNVWVDVPIATYGVFGVGKTPAQDRLCLLIGTEVPLPADTLSELYRNRGQYVSRINRRLMEHLQSDGRAFLTGTVLRGRFALRACVLHYQTSADDLAALIDAVRETGEKLVRSVDFKTGGAS